MAPRVFVIRPATERPTVTELLDEATDRSRGQGLDVKTFRSRRVTMFDEARERSAEFLEPDDAHGIYRALHEADVLTVASQKTYVRKDPRRDPPARRVAVSVSEFVQYKGLCVLVRSDREITEALSSLRTWCGAPPGCLGMDDPRTLPFHVFDAESASLGLDEHGARAQFAAAFGSASNRTDLGGKTWSRADHMHGSFAVRVSRCDLPDGAHWDVSARRSVLLCVSNCVWKIDGRRGGYANVYPNANVRLTARSQTRKVWP